MTEEDFAEGYFRLRRGGAMEGNRRRGHVLAFGMQDRAAAGVPPRAAHAPADTTPPPGSPAYPSGTVPSSAIGRRRDKCPMAFEEAQASVPSRACPSPGRRGLIPTAASNTCAGLWTFWRPNPTVHSQSKPSRSEHSQSAGKSGKTRHTVSNVRRRAARLLNQGRVTGGAGQMQNKRERGSTA